MTYSGGQRSARRAPAPQTGSVFGPFVNALMNVGRGAQAAFNPNFSADEYTRNWERQNQIEAQQRALLDRIPTRGTEVGITTGLDRDGNVDRTQSDTYKQYAQTPGGQFERYFKTPEMDQYFGAASRGATAPKDVEAMQALAGQTVAPGKTPEELSAFYRAESAMGRAQMPEIRKGLGYAEGSDLAKWAEANPMLAQRLYAKQQGGRPLAPDQETVMGDLGSRAQEEGGYTPAAFGMPANPIPPTQQPGPGGMDQGARVSYFRGSENIAPLQAMKTTGEGMPAFQTTGESLKDRVDAFAFKVANTKLGGFGA